MSDVTTIVPYFGSDRMVASQIGAELTGLSWLGVPFCGGMSVLQHVDCRSIVVNDLHRHVMNLAMVIHSGYELGRELSAMPFHPDVLAQAQAYCREVEGGVWSTVDMSPRWAFHYFITQWMGRSGFAGTEREFQGNLSTRWTSSGGDSNTRYRSAIRALVTWRRIMRRCNFTTLDVFDFLKDCKDQEGHGLYLDPPWMKDGDKYKFKFTEKDHRRLADLMHTFTKARVVIRYGEHPLIRGLYPEPRWNWRELTGRTQGNNDKAEVLITNQSRGRELF